MQKKKKMNPYKKTLIIISLVFFIFMFSGITYSYINTNGTNKQIDAIVLNEGDLAITYFDGNEVNLPFPTKSNYRYQFSVTNTSTNRIYYSVYLNNKEVYDSNVRVILENDKRKKIYDEKIKKGENLVQSIIQIEPNSTDRYTLTIRNKNNKSSIKGLIKVKNESIDNESFQDIILNDNNIKSNPLTEVGTLTNQDEGLITTSDDYGTSYYYRGNVKNNYAKIGDFDFRIIRVNGDGTVRLILDEPIETDYEFTTSIETNKENSVLLDKSTIKDELNSWLNKNLFDYKDYFVASNFCTDTSFNDIKDDIKYSSIYTRVNSNNYTLKCFTNSYLSKIGFISVDEIIFAGGNINEANTSYYLYNSNSSTWTTSSYSYKDNINMYYLNDEGKIDNIEITNKTKIRPVINIGLKANVTGEGTIDNPYILVK